MASSGALLHNEPSTHKYLEGVELFNTEQFWEAHECWEECWRVSNEPDATFYKGIIQAAAALVHWQRGNPRGLVRNWEKARPKLLGLPSVMHNADITGLIRAMDAFAVLPQPPVPRICLNQ